METKNLTGQVAAFQFANLPKKTPEVVRDLFEIIQRLEKENFAQSDLIAKLESENQLLKTVAIDAVLLSNELTGGQDEQQSRI